MSRYLVFLCFSFAFMLSDVFGASTLNTKRAVYRRRHASPSSSKATLTVKDLTVELAKTHNDLDKIKESVSILQRDSCTNIKAVGKPVTHNSRYYTHGAWMKDPLGIMGTETIFVMPSYTGINILEEYTNMEMFKAGVAHKEYILPYKWDATGGVVYGPYLYYNREASTNIIKYNLHTGRIDAQITISGYTPRKNYYAWGGYSGIDLAVDEQGLWVLWGSTGNSQRLHASKVDVIKNVVTQTWNLATEKMNTMGSAFVACGVIYCVDSYSAKSTTINFAYDTKTGKQWNPNIQFTNQYNDNSMVDYNPRERVLYSWDNKRQVTYSLTFEEA